MTAHKPVIHIKRGCGIYTAAQAAGDMTANDVSKLVFIQCADDLLGNEFQNGFI
ncbi:MAG: hypothetical protein ACYCUV_06110 [Phycisphaerae bacterium]